MIEKLATLLYISDAAYQYSGSPDVIPRLSTQVVRSNHSYMRVAGQEIIISISLVQFNGLSSHPDSVPDAFPGHIPSPQPNEEEGKGPQLTEKP